MSEQCVHCISCRDFACVKVFCLVTKFPSPVTSGKNRNLSGSGRVLMPVECHSRDLVSRKGNLNWSLEDEHCMQARTCSPLIDLMSFFTTSGEKPAIASLAYSFVCLWTMTLVYQDTGYSR